MGIELLDPIAVPVTPRDFDVIVPDDQPDPQAGDDAQGDRPYTMLVRRDTYVNAFDIDGDYILVVCEPNTLWQAQVALSGQYVALVMQPGGDFAVVLEIIGSDNSLLLFNYIDLDGIRITGDRAFIDGRGWSSISIGDQVNLDGIEVEGDDAIIRAIAASSLAGGGGVGDGIRVENLRANLVICKIIDSDRHAIRGELTARDMLILGCSILDADERGMHIGGPRNRIIGNWIAQSGDDGISPEDGGDDSVMTGNIVDNTGGTAPIDITVNAENNVVAGNRTDGAINDLSGTSTVGDNNVVAF